MNYQSALTEFAGMLQIGAGALEKIASQQSPEIQSHFAELESIATRLREIGHEIAKAATGDQT